MRMPSPKDPEQIRLSAIIKAICASVDSGRYDGVPQTPKQIRDRNHKITTKIDRKESPNGTKPR